jgi:hypothetical protein
MMTQKAQPGKTPRQSDASSHGKLRLAWRLQVWQVTIASVIARAIRSRNRPSAKQAAQADSAFEAAIQKGFRPAVLQTI